MDYEQFFPTQSFNQQCLPFAYVLTGLTAISMVVFTCLCDKREEKNAVKRIQAENDTLKRIILKSVDKMLVRMIKNGYDIDNDDEE